ncbi:MAG: hypothetical protein QJR02_06805 [Sinobacteraceae bacterium]|nr:hypothetical protein [Nevskiaceae bacterium]
MVLIAVVLFLIAALGGLAMAVRIFQGKQPPVPLAVGHGILAATALVLTLLAAAATGSAAPLKYGAGLLVIAALGGFFLLSFQLRSKAHPKPIVVLHALLAVAGVVCLLLTLI